jgi:F-type H+-transporting ATPase subunit b
MQVDWITVAAQVVNFLVLVWLLKRFLYRPVIDAMERREQRLAERSNETEERERVAEERREEYEEKARELEQQRYELIEHTKEDAEVERRRLLDAAREQVAEAREHWKNQTEKEREDFLKSLRSRSAEAIEAAMRKALTDLADTGLEEQVVHSFISRLGSLDRASRKALASADGPVQVTTSFKLDGPARARLTRAIHDHLVDGIDVIYRTSAELGFGIELVLGGRRLGWSLADYLEQLANRVEDAFAAARATE